MLKLPLLLLLPLSLLVLPFRLLTSMLRLINIVLLPLLMFLLVLLISAFLVLLVRFRIMSINSCRVLVTVPILLALRNMVIRRVAMLIHRLWRVFKQIVYASFQRGLSPSRLLISGVRGCASCVLRIRECLTRSVFSFFRGKKSSMLFT